MYHELSGLEYDFQGGSDKLLELVLKGVSIEELIRGTFLRDTYAFMDDDGNILKVNLNLMNTAELIDWRNEGSDPDFMDELPTIQIDEEKLAQVRNGALAKDVLTDEDIQKITHLVREHVALSFQYADEEVFYDSEDEPLSSGSIKESQTSVTTNSKEETSIQAILETTPPVFGNPINGLASFKARKEYQDFFKKEPPIWMNHIAANLISEIIAYSIRNEQPIPAQIVIPLKCLESSEKDKILSKGWVIGNFLILDEHKRKLDPRIIDQILLTCDWAHLPQEVIDEIMKEYDPRPLTMKISEDQSELDEILSQRYKQFTKSEREALVLCDATEDYPWRSVRSKVNGACLYVEKDGVWQFPKWDPWEGFKASYPDWTNEELEEAEDKYLPF